MKYSSQREQQKKAERTALAVLLILIVMASLVGFNQAEARSIELIGGGVVTHPYMDAVGEREALSAFSNKLTDTGVIAPAFLGARLQDQLVNSYSAFTVFGGQNSIGEAMCGATYSFGYSGHGLDAGAVFGAYWQDDQKFYDRGVRPFSVGNLVPVIAGELNIDILEHTWYRVKLHNVISPVITQHTIGVEFDIK